MRDAVLAEFRGPEELLRAIRAMREAGHRDLDAYTPYPLHEVEHALGLRRSRLPKVCCVAGLAGAGAAYALQWLLNAYLYPLNVGGRPPHFPLAYVIITFEMGVLAAAITAFIGILATAKLPTLWHPVDEIPGFEDATDHRFWLAVTGRAARDEVDATERRLAETAPLRVVRMLDGRIA